MPLDDEDPLDQEDEGEDQNEDSDSEAGESDAGKDPKSTDKRIRDLQSQKDQETARANKAEKQLKALLGSGRNGGAEGGNPPSGGNVGEDAVLDMARMFALQQHPKLAEYGLSTSDLDGSTPSEIAEYATGLVARIEKIETQARNKVLAESGMAPEIEAGTPRKKSRDFSAMSKEDFDKVVAEALKG